MADILYQLRQEASQVLLENGTAGVGALQFRELGYCEAVLEASLKENGGAFRHFPTREKLILAAAALSSGAKLIGYFPAAGLSATTVQDALDELRGQVAAGGGGTVGGTMTPGTIPKASGANTLADSILAEVGGKIQFSGDAVANLYRTSAGILRTDGALQVAGDASAGGDFSAGGHVAGNGILCFQWFDSPITDVSASTHTPGNHHVIRYTHATPAITLPLAGDVGGGREYWLYFQNNSGSISLSGADVWLGLRTNLGVGVEGGHATLSGNTGLARVKSNGVDSWYVWQEAA